MSKFLMAHPEKLSIAIVGGGLAGLTLSIGLTRHGIPHKIYESASKFAEIGAGIALGPNSITALELIDPRIGEGLKKCITYNEGIDEEGKGDRKGEFLDIRVGEENGFNTLITTVCYAGTKPGRACVHRAKFLDELIKLIPPNTASFGKSLTSISEVPSTGELSLSFTDGTTALASAVIACDGIKSIVRQKHFLSTFPNQRDCRPVFANEFGYRGIFSRDEFLEVTGGAIDCKGSLFCGPDSYVVMYPVEKGGLMNIVAVKRIPPPTPDSEFAVLLHESEWVQPVTADIMVSDFAAWGTPIKALISRIKRPERWALYDHLSAPTYVKGRVALLGDSAHASTPHQGQGAGMAFEDSFILSSIMGEFLKESNEAGNGEPATANTNARTESCLRAYDAVRRPRTQKLTRTSREMGEVIGFSGEGIGRDFDKMKANLNARMNWIWDIDLQGEVRRGVEIAKEELKKIP